MDSGIYKITNVVNDKIYIGQSINVDNRLNNHLKELIKGVHINYFLQKDFNKYGECNFKFEKIYSCDEEFLNPMEKHFIEKYNTTNNGYNIKNGNSSINSKIKEYKRQNKEHVDALKEFENIESMNIFLDDETYKSYRILKDFEYLSDKMCLSMSHDGVNIKSEAIEDLCTISKVISREKSFIKKIEEYIYIKVCNTLNPKYKDEIFIDCNNRNCWTDIGFGIGDNGDYWFWCDGDRNDSRISFTYMETKSRLIKTKNIRVIFSIK